MNDIKIVYLYSEYMGYTASTVNKLVEYGAEVHIVHLPTPYKPEKKSNVYYYQRENLGFDDIQILLKDINPLITVVSGWEDNTYLKCAKNLIRNHKIVVLGIDNIWHNTIRQKIASYLGMIGYFKKFFSNAWVAGPYQYQYAREIGFRKDEIIYDLYSCDISQFDKARKSREKKIGVNNYPYKFLFVGRLEDIKGIDLLLKSWTSIKDKNNWELHIIGNGSMKTKLESHNDVFLKEFMQPEELISEFLKYGCFILPSKSEPWGLVVHEAVSIGMPIILSDVVGSATEFLINGYNGLSFKNGNIIDLRAKMEYIIRLSDDDLLNMSNNSFKISKRITPSTSARNLLSLLY